MYLYQNWPDFSLNEDDPARQNKYSGPLIPIELLNNNTSPQPLAPLGANARVLDGQQLPQAPTSNYTSSENLLTDNMRSYVNSLSQSLNPNQFGNPNLNPGGDLLPQKSPIDYSNFVADEEAKRRENNLQPWSEMISKSESSMNDLFSKNKDNIDEAINVGDKAGGGAGLGTIASAGMGFAKDLLSVRGVDGSEKESWAKTGQLTLSGATTGMQIAGPWGAAVGAVVGAGAGLINKRADKRKRGHAIHENNMKQARDSKKQRLVEYEIEQAEKEIELLNSYRKREMNFIRK